MRWPVFWTEYTGEADVILRRYTTDDRPHAEREGTCPVNGWYHTRGSGPVDRIAYPADPDGYFRLDVGAENYAGNQWWPEFCACGYRFTDDDVWQAMEVRIYRARDGRSIDGRSEWRLRNMPVGAVWDVGWHSDVDAWIGWDGRAIGVRCPVAGHDFQPDSQASNCTRRCPWQSDDDRERYPEHANQTMWFRSKWTTTPQGVPYEASIAPHNERCDPRFLEHKCWVRVGDAEMVGEPLHISKDGSELGADVAARFKETCAAGAGSIVTPDWHGFLHRGVLQ